MGDIHLTVGPTQLHPAAVEAYQHGITDGVASISHRSDDYMLIHRETTSQLRRLFDLPDSVHIFFLGSGTEAMERLIAGTVISKSFHLVNGAFSKKWFSIAHKLGKTPSSYEVGFAEGFSGRTITPPSDAELICVTQNETSTGVYTGDTVIRQLREHRPDALIAVDAVSAAPCYPLDFSFIDAAFFSVQKGFGLPAGLGVLMCDDRMLDKVRSRDDGCCIGSYHSLLSLEAKAKKDQTPTTPNVLAIHALGKVAKKLADKGMSSLHDETKQKARMLYEALESRGFRIFPANDRSSTIIVAEVADPDTIRKVLAEQGVNVSKGYGPYKGNHVRIANYPQHTLKDIRSLISALNAVNRDK